MHPTTLSVGPRLRGYLTKCQNLKPRPRSDPLIKILCTQTCRDFSDRRKIACEVIGLVQLELMNRYDSDSRVHPSACLPLVRATKESISHHESFSKFFGGESLGSTTLEEVSFTK